MKKEVSNQFTEGLISDLNPINTPNTVLTDAVNATIITYNGNEYCLQNDRGNYELKNCKLYPNYIPVGIKEYNDILYIVSYNPLTKYVQIGSYPSPLIIGELPYDQPEVELKSIIEEQILNQNLTEKNYTELMENAKGLMFDGENFKLNPGDEYCIQLDPSDIKYKYETLAYYILDEESGLHDVTDKIKNDEFGTDPNYEHVGWTVPGWFNIQPRLAELGVAGINVRSFYLPKNTDGTPVYFKFNLKLNLNDTYLKNKGILDEWCKLIDEGKSLEDVKFRIYVEKEVGEGEYESIYSEKYVEFSISDTEDPVKEFHLSEYNWNEWYDSNIILWKTISGKFTDLTKKDKLKITMIPVLHDLEYNYKILYDNLKQELLFDLSVSEDNLWSGGDELYQFFPSKDLKSQHIYINIVGPMISSFPVDLYCNIYDLQKNLVLENYKFEDYSGIGENLLTIPYTDTFKKENIYVIEFIFGNSPNDETFPKLCKFLITSEIFNNYKNILVYDRDISFEEWVNEYWNYCSIETKVDVKTIKGIGDKVKYFDNSSELSDDDLKYQSNNQNNTFFPIQNELSDEIILQKGYTNLNNNVKFDVSYKQLDGDIWNSLAPSIEKLYKTPFSDELFTFNDNIFRQPISHYLETKLKYDIYKEGGSFIFADIKESNFKDDLKDYSGDSLNNITWSKDTPSLDDIRIEIEITVAGRKAEKEDEEEQRFLICTTSLYENYKIIDVKNLFNDDIKSSNTFIENSICWVNNKLSFYIQGMGSRCVLDLPKYFIITILNKLNLPFIPIKVIYNGIGTTDNWEIHQIVFGGEPTPDFDLAITSSKKQILWYIGMKSTTSSDSGDAMFPVLLPLTTSNESAPQYIKNLCKNLVVASDSDLLSCNVFQLHEQETKEVVGFNPVLKFNFGCKEYFGYNLCNKESRKNIISNLNFNIQHKNIILNGENLDVTYRNIDFSHDFESFDKNKYPYQNITVDEGVNSNINLKTYTGLNDLRENLKKWFSHWSQDKDKWMTSNYYNELINNHQETISGLYLLKGDSKPLLNELNKNYKDTGVISLDIEKWNNLDGKTGEIFSDLNFTWVFNLALGVFLPIPNATGGDALLVWITKDMGGDGNIDKGEITDNGYISWFIYTNKDKVNAMSARCYITLGMCWKNNFELGRLDDYWSPAIKYSDNES